MADWRIAHSFHNYPDVLGVSQLCRTKLGEEGACLHDHILRDHLGDIETVVHRVYSDAEADSHR